MNNASFFDIQFWQQLVTTIVGIALGIPGALYIDRCVRQSNERQEKAELLEALYSTLKRNWQLANTLAADLSKSQLSVVYYPMDLTILDATSSQRYNFGSILHVLPSIEHARYELTHLDGKLLMLRTHAPSINTSQAADQFAIILNAAIRAHIPIVQKALRVAMDSVEIEKDKT